MMPKCFQKIRKGVPESHLVDRNAQIEKLRFDCAGASGSRVRRAGKHVKSNERWHANEHSAHTWFFCKFCHERLSKRTPILATFYNDFECHFQAPKKQKKTWSRKLAEGTLHTYQIRGELGGIWEASGGMREWKRKDSLPTPSPSEWKCMFWPDFVFVGMLMAFSSFWHRWLLCS